MQRNVKLENYKGLGEVIAEAKALGFTHCLYGLGKPPTSLDELPQVIHRQFDTLVRIRKGRRTRWNAPEVRIVSSYDDAVGLYGIKLV